MTYEEIVAKVQTFRDTSAKPEFSWAYHAYLQLNQIRRDTESVMRTLGPESASPELAGVLDVLKAKTAEMHALFAE